jgi:hypothetical protein
VLYNIADEQATAFQRLEDQLTYCHDASPSAEILLDTDKIFVRLSTGQALAFDRDCCSAGLEVVVAVRLLSRKSNSRQIAMQVLCIAMLLNSFHPALEDCEIFLNSSELLGRRRAQAHR